MLEVSSTENAFQSGPNKQATEAHFLRKQNPPINQLVRSKNGTDQKYPALKHLG